MVTMDANELRAAQAPLKERYKQSGAEALTPLAATGDGSGAPPTFSVHQTGSITQAGLHAATGGDGSDACSGDMLLEAVLACAGVTLRAVALASGVELRSLDGRANASFDARGTLGIDRSVPVGIQDLTLDFTADTDATTEQLERLARMTERYCVVGQSLAEPPTITVRRAQ
jgi:Predicted redox protein, regulator of disulfide bond formation